MTKKTAGRVAGWAMVVLALAAPGVQHVAAAGKAKPAAPAEPEAGEGAVSCAMHGDGVVDIMGQSAAYLFIGARPACADAGRKQRFCAALQTREGYDTVREHSLDAEKAVDVARTLPEEMQALYLQQHPRRSLDQAFVACALKPEAVRAKLANDAAANLQVGKSGRVPEDLEFLRREASALIEPIWNRECAGRVTGKSGGELGIGVDFKGNRAFETFCLRTTQVDKDKAPGRFGR